jgi:hypothetical protein
MIAYTQVESVRATPRDSQQWSCLRLLAHLPQRPFLGCGQGDQPAELRFQFGQGRVHGGELRIGEVQRNGVLRHRFLSPVHDPAPAPWP